MEIIFFTVVIISLAVGVISRLSASISSSNFRSKEVENVEEIKRLRNLISTKKDKVQALRLGTYKPTSSERVKYEQNPKMRPSLVNTALVQCYYCDEVIERSAFVCRHCARPVFSNTPKFKEQLRALRSNA